MNKYVVSKLKSHYKGHKISWVMAQRYYLFCKSRAVVHKGQNFSAHSQSWSWLGGIVAGVLF